MFSYALSLFVIPAIDNVAIGKDSVKPLLFLEIIYPFSQSDFTYKLFIEQQNLLIISLHDVGVKSPALAP